MQESSSSTKNDNDHENNEPPSKNAKAAEKKKLIEQIKELRFIIKQCKQDLQISCFKDVEKYVTKEHLQRLEISPRELPNVEYDLQTDLYRFAGFWCVKSQRHELIFNFTSSNKEQKDYTYAVQIFIENKKSTLGKWVMPMSINMDQLLSETPIKEPKDLISFVKNCKHHVACYTVRQEQFLSLQKHISQIKYCTLQTDIGFRLISLELFGTYDKENNKYMNLIIHLRYYSDKARPYAIEVDTRDKSKLSDETKQKLKSWLKKFRMYNLQTAFDKILKEDSIFIWTQTNDESLLELNDTSSSEEENFLVQSQSARKKLRNLKKKHMLQKKWSEWKKKKNVRNTTLSEESEEDSHSKAKVPRTESPSKNLMKRKKKPEKAIPNSKKEKINKNLLVETTPIVKIKLKQTKLNFQTNEMENSNTNRTSLFNSQQSSTNNIHNKNPLKATSNISPSKKSKTTKLVTSTPLFYNKNVEPLSLSPNMDNIVESPIKMPEQTTNKMNSSQVKNKLKNKMVQRTTRQVAKKKKLTSNKSNK